MAKSPRLPLSGLRVIDFGQVFSVPYLGAQLADLGAEDIKIEGPQRAAARNDVFHNLNRGKLCLGLDMTKDEAKDLIRKLVAVSDIVIENFTPRVMPGWGLSFDELKKINPRIILLSNCGYGATGPWGPLPIQGTSLEATNGIIKYSGWPDAAQKAGQSYPDFLACWTGVFAVFTALEALQRTGEGQWVDQSMYQIGVSLIPQPLLQYQIDGSDYERIGNRDRVNAPSNVYHAAGEDKWITLHVDSDEKWQKLLQIMGRTDLANDPRFFTLTARQQNIEDLDELVNSWTSKQDGYEAMKTLNEAGIAAMPVLDNEGVHFDPQFLDRGFLQPVDFGGETGVRPLFGRPYNMKNTPIELTKGAPAFGDANGYVLRDILKLPEDEIAKLYEMGVVADKPTVEPTINPGTIRAGTGDRMDEDFTAKIRQHWSSAPAPEGAATAAN